MRTWPKEKQLQNIFIDSVDKQPVRFDMTFSESLVFSGQSMVPILVLKFFLLRKNIHNFLQPLDLKSSFSGQLKIFSELIRWVPE